MTVIDTSAKILVPARLGVPVTVIGPPLSKSAVDGKSQQAHHGSCLPAPSLFGWLPRLRRLVARFALTVLTTTCLITHAGQSLICTELGARDRREHCQPLCVSVTTAIMDGSPASGEKSWHGVSVDIVQNRGISCFYKTGTTYGVIPSMDDKFSASVEPHGTDGIRVELSGSTRSGVNRVLQGYLEPIEYELSLVLNRGGAWNLGFDHKRFPRHSVSVGYERVYDVPHKKMNLQELRRALGETCCVISGRSAGQLSPPFELDLNVSERAVQPAQSRAPSSRFGALQTLTGTKEGQLTPASDARNANDRRTGSPFESINATQGNERVELPRHGEDEVSTNSEDDARPATQQENVAKRPYDERQREVPKLGHYRGASETGEKVGELTHAQAREGLHRVTESTASAIEDLSIEGVERKDADETYLIPIAPSGSQAGND